jgi:hypothetical protein
METRHRKRPLPSIHSILCRIRSRGLRRAIRQVLDQVRERRPRDFGRLRSLVRIIVPLPKAEARDGTLGRWQKNSPVRDDPSTWAWGFEDTPGILYLSEGIEAAHAVAVVAHEFGHGCATDSDLKRRGDVGDEWAEELTADWYAYKWGFGRSSRGSGRTDTVCTTA